MGSKDYTDTHSTTSHHDVKNFIKIRLAVVATIATTAIIVIGIIITMLAIKQYNNPSNNSNNSNSRHSISKNTDINKTTTLEMLLRVIT